jgi:hypothetical protein
MKRLIAGWRARRFAKERERLLDSENPVLAFAGNPAAGTQQLRPGETNDAAFALLNAGGVRLTRIHDGAEVSARAFDRLVFVEPWDPLSATVIGSHRRPFDAGRLRSFGIVFLSTGRADFASRVAAAWYNAVAYVLDENDPLREQVAIVPFAAVKNADGSFAFAEGLDGSSFRESAP